jgi:hypothetical protein
MKRVLADILVLCWGMFLCGLIGWRLAQPDHYIVFVGAAAGICMALGAAGLFWDLRGKIFAKPIDLKKGCNYELVGYILTTKGILGILYNDYNPSLQNQKVICIKLPFSPPLETRYIRRTGTPKKGFSIECFDKRLNPINP